MARDRAKAPCSFGARLALLASLATQACVSHSIRDDLDRVSRRARVELAPALDTPEVDVESRETVRRTLAAPMTAEDAVRVAIGNNRALRASLRELGVYRGRLVQAGLVANPAVEFDIRHPNDPVQPVQLDLALEWDLTHSLLAPVRAGVARAELDAARHRAASAVIDLGFRVRSAVFAMQASRARLTVATRALDTFAAGRDAARALTESGNTLALDRVTHEAAYESARVTVAQLELELLERREALTRLLGAHGDETEWRLRDELPSVPDRYEVAPDLERRAITASLALQEQRSALEAHARRTGLTRIEGLVPDVSVDVHIEQDGQFWEVGGGARHAPALRPPPGNAHRQRSDLRRRDGALPRRRIGHPTAVRRPRVRPLPRLRPSALCYRAAIVPPPRTVRSPLVSQAILCWQHRTEDSGEATGDRAVIDSSVHRPTIGGMASPPDQSFVISRYAS